MNQAFNKSSYSHRFVHIIFYTITKCKSQLDIIFVNEVLLNITFPKIYKCEKNVTCFPTNMNISNTVTDIKSVNLSSLLLDIYKSK